MTSSHNMHCLLRPALAPNLGKLIVSVGRPPLLGMRGSLSVGVSSGWLGDGQQCAAQRTAAPGSSLKGAAALQCSCLQGMMAWPKGRSPSLAQLTGHRLGAEHWTFVHALSGQDCNHAGRVCAYQGLLDPAVRSLQLQILGLQHTVQRALARLQLLDLQPPQSLPTLVANAKQAHRSAVQRACMVCCSLCVLLSMMVACSLEFSC